MTEFSSDSEEKKSEPWFSLSGPDTDVVLSTRVRLARNLANFPFPSRFKDDDCERVQAIICDSFAHSSRPDFYQFYNVSTFNQFGGKFLEERGCIESCKDEGDIRGVIISSDGRLTCTINDIDHLRISSFAAGLDGEAAFKISHDLDEELQNTMQFAASYDCGFLTSAIKDSGSGMKISCRLHLPALSFTGKLKDFSNYFASKNVEIKDCFGAGYLPSSSLGFFYQISSSVSCIGSELDQIASLVSVAKYISEQERRENEFVIKNHQTQLRDRIYRAYAKLKFASLIEVREGIEIISDVKWGKNLGFFSNVTDELLSALLYRSQPAHLRLFLDRKDLNFSQDIAENAELKQNNLRAVILQESLEEIKVN